MAVPLPLSGIHHGLGLNPVVLIVPPGLRIFDANGVFRLPIPPAPISTPFYVQAVFVSTNPGYGPAAFSNVLRINR